MPLITTADLAPFKADVPEPPFDEDYIHFDAEFDIFLSNKFSDRDELGALVRLLESFGYHTFVDWMVDTHRNEISPGTARWLKEIMDSSKCLLFATTSTSSDSKWMPWELGFFDGMNGRVAICPVVSAPTKTFVGQEYLGIYPYVEKRGKQLVIRWPEGRGMSFDAWLR